MPPLREAKGIFVFVALSVFQVYNAKMKNTIKAHTDFNFEEAEIVRMPAFFMKYRPKKYDSGQYGLVVSKRAFPLAVRRNRAKRLLRVWIAKCGLPQNLDFLFIARPEILATKLPDGAAQVAKAVKKSGVQCRKPEVGSPKSNGGSPMSEVRLHRAKRD
jgi:ribonuclease P protein component